MKKEFWLIIILAIIIAALGAVTLWPKTKTPNNSPPQNLQGMDGLEITSPAANAEISSPLKITGKVTGNGWAGFESQVGTVAFVLDKDQTHDVATFLKATTDWTKLPTNFEATFDFLPSGSGKLIFKNENPSGDPAKSKEFVLPVKVVQSSSETMAVKLFFNNNKMDPSASCNKVFAVERQITKIEAVGSAALWQLLMGPTQAEKDAGFFTSINPDVKLQSLEIDKNGTATADFDKTLEQGIGGSCKVSAIRAEITETLKQFPTIKNVIISINGRTADILQP